MRDIAALLGPAARTVFGIFGLEVIRKATHRGISLETDLKRILPSAGLTFVDAGANVGSFSTQLTRHFMDATIYAFEPVPQTFAILQKRVSTFVTIKPVQAALGERTGSATMQICDQSLWNRIVSGSPVGVRTATVDMLAIDDFCGQAGLDRISLLKTDCEGYDNEVIHGASRMLQRDGSTPSIAK